MYLYRNRRAKSEEQEQRNKSYSGSINIIQIQAVSIVLSVLSTEFGLVGFILNLGIIHKCLALALARAMIMIFNKVVNYTTNLHSEKHAFNF
jgi:hypothetical protein